MVWVRVKKICGTFFSEESRCAVPTAQIVSGKIGEKHLKQFL